MKSCSKQKTKNSIAATMPFVVRKRLRTALSTNAVVMAQILRATRCRVSTTYTIASKTRVDNNATTPLLQHVPYGSKPILTSIAHQRTRHETTAVIQSPAVRARIVSTLSQYSASYGHAIGVCHFSIVSILALPLRRYNIAPSAFCSSRTNFTWCSIPWPSSPVYHPVGLPRGESTSEVPCVPSPVWG